MEGPKFRFTALDARGNMYCQTEVDFVETMLVEDLKNVIFAHTQDLKAQMREKDNYGVFSLDRKTLPPKARILTCFPNAKTEWFKVFVVHRNEAAPEPQYAGPAAAVQPLVANGAPNSVVGKDVAMKAAKNIKALARVDEDRLVNALLEQCSGTTMSELAELKKPPAGKRAKGSSNVNSRKAEWTLFYNAIKNDVSKSLEEYARTNGGPLERTILVDAVLSFQDFSHQHAQGNSGGKRPGELEVVRMWVQSADTALRTSQRFAIANCITLGKRLLEARSRWDTLKGTNEAARDGLHTLEAFYNFLGIGYTVDYIRKLIHIGTLGDLFPNLALISCCGIGEIIKYASDFIEVTKMSPTEALFWRCTLGGQFAWTRHTNVMAMEGTKRHKAFEFREEAEDEQYAAWMAKGVESMNEILAEDEAARILMAEKADEVDDLVQEKLADLESEL